MQISPSCLVSPLESAPLPGLAAPELPISYEFTLSSLQYLWPSLHGCVGAKLYPKSQHPQAVRFSFRRSWCLSRRGLPSSHKFWIVFHRWLRSTAPFNNSF